jgi:signal transduction histidine kinase
MNAQEHQLLLLDADDVLADTLRASLTWTGSQSFHLRRASNLASALSHIAQGGIDAVLIVISPVASTPWANLEHVCSVPTAPPVIGFSPAPSLADATRAVRLGAQDLLSLNPLEPDELTRTIQLAIERDRKLVRDSGRRKEGELGIVAGQVALDFNNLLQSIVAYATVALDDLENGLSVRSDLEEIRDLALRGAQLSDQMLSWAGDGAFSVRTLDVSKLVEDTRDRLEEAVSLYADLDISLGADLPPIWGDAGQVRQMLLQLVTNASEALPATGGRIQIRTGQGQQSAEVLETSVTRNELPPGHYVTIDVQDDGRGLQPERVQKIFEPLVSTKGPGRGLGLSTLRDTVEAHRGAVVVHSTLGRGTRIRLLFPTDAGPAVPDAGHAEHQANPEARTVLVVDDQSDIRKWLAFFLERRGYTVVCACDGVEATEVFQSCASELVAVILDQSMPRMSGAEAFRIMKRHDDRVPIFLISGWKDDVALDSLMDEGLTGFLKKPFQPDEILQRLEQLTSTNT